MLELGNRMADDFVVAHDRDLITILGQDRTMVFDVRTHRRSAIPSSCEVADRHGSRWLLLCHKGDAQPDSQDRKVFGPPGGGVRIADGALWMRLPA